jgi:hypothetical protein
MDETLRRDRFTHAVTELLAEERRLLEVLKRDQAIQKPPEAEMLRRRLHDQAEDHIAALAAYLSQTSGESEAAPLEVVDGVLASSSSAALRRMFVQVNALAICYTELDALAMRLFEPPLRELAPRHLRVYAGAAQAITPLLPRVVAA